MICVNHIKGFSSLSRTACTSIVQSHLTSSLHFRAVLYRLVCTRRTLQIGKALIILERSILSVAACTSIMQNHLTSSLHNHAVLYRLVCIRRTVQVGKCICQIIHFVFPYFTLLNSEATGNGIPKFIYYPLYVHFMHQESKQKININIVHIQLILN